IGRRADPALTEAPARGASDPAPVEVRDRGTGDLASVQARDRRAEAGDRAGGDVMVEVQHQGDVVGELGVGLAGPQLSEADQRALKDLAAPAGVALATVRLTVELRRRVAEVAEQTRELQASRQRMVNARRHEQERTWARLTATVLPKISAISGSLAEFRAAAKAGDRGDDHLEVAQREAREALEALREVARGIFPAVLTDSGLEVALQAWTDKRSPGRQVIVDGDLRPLHRQPAAEAALYYACTVAVEETAGGLPGIVTSGTSGMTSGSGLSETAMAALKAVRAHPFRPPPVVLSADGQAAHAGIVLPGAPQEGTRRAIRDRLEALEGSLRIYPATGTPPEPAHTPSSGAGSVAGRGAAGEGPDDPTGPAVLVATVPLTQTVTPPSP
ncbi:MAG: hypothetical protein J2O47_09955, partial [Acidimicrobiaceae bacterium]|nr:hypothetical protein [Acidimicrobiaceae bacterium]